MGTHTNIRVGLFRIVHLLALSTNGGIVPRLARADVFDPSEGADLQVMANVTS